MSAKTLHPEFVDCQREIEGAERCTIQCNHCKDYYSLLVKLRATNPGTLINQQEDEDNEHSKFINV